LVSPAVDLESGYFYADKGSTSRPSKPPPSFAAPKRDNTFYFLFGRQMTVDEQGTSVATSPEKSKATHSSTPGRPWGWIVGVMVVAIGGSAGAYYAWDHGRQKSADHGGGRSESDKPVVGMPVEVAHPRQGGIERTTTQAGSVHAFEHAALYAKVSGYLKAQNVDIGDRVKPGQILAVIDDPEVDKAVDQNQAALDQSQAKVRVAEAKIRSAQAAKAAAEAMVKQAQTMVAAKLSNEVLQAKQLKRIAGLVARDAVEMKLEDEQKDRFDVATAEVGVARAEVISAQAQVMNKEALVEEARADLIEAQANVEVAQANLGRAKVMQDYTRITSPYDGVITVRSFHRGDFIRSASEGGNVPVLAVARTNLMRVVLPVPDTDVPFVNKGDKATLHIVALPGKTFTGVVSRYSESEDSQSRNMRTEVDLPNPDDNLREGMFGRVTLILQAAAPNSVTIPSSGLIGQSGTGSGSVYVVRDGKARKVDVQVGNDNGVESEILSGLTTEDLVITSYNGSITDGTPVHAELKPAARSGH
jgi:HlyD family secretion protein